jgi:hypothetical protein
VGWSAGTVAISEALGERNAGIRCYSRHGELLWRYKGRKGQTSPLMYSPESGRYIGVDYAAGPADRLLVQWDEETGSIQNEQAIPSHMHGRLCAKGRLMFCIDFKTFETAIYDV